MSNRLLSYFTNSCTSTTL